MRPAVAAWDRSLATAAQVDALVVALETALYDTEFLDPTNPGQTMTRLRRLFSRQQMDETEVQILRGVIKHLARAGQPIPDPVSSPRPGE